MPRDAQILRQWRVWRLLSASRTPLSAEGIAASLRPDVTSARTVRRDLEVLRQIGAGIVEVGQGRDRRYGTTDDGPGVRLDADTLLALRLALGLMRPLDGTPVGECLDQLVRQLESRVHERVLQHFRPLADDLLVRSSGAPSYAGSAPVMDALREAIAKGRRVSIDYAPLHGPAATRVVHPQAVVYGPRGLYLLALDETRAGSIRTFRVERIASARVEATPARRDPSFDAEVHLAGSIGIASPEHAPRAFVIRLFSEAVVRILTENPWHTSQRIDADADGAWTLTIELTSARELASRVLALGADAEVVQPAAFRVRVVEAVRATAQRYAPTDPGPDLTRTLGIPSGRSSSRREAGRRSTDRGVSP